MTTYAFCDVRGKRCLRKKESKVATIDPLAKGRRCNHLSLHHRSDVTRQQWSRSYYPASWIPNILGADKRTANKIDSGDHRLLSYSYLQPIQVKRLFYSTRDLIRILASIGHANVGTNLVGQPLQRSVPHPAQVFLRPAVLA